MSMAHLAHWFGARLAFSHLGHGPQMSVWIPAPLPPACSSYTPPLRTRATHTTQRDAQSLLSEGWGLMPL